MGERHLADRDLPAGPRGDLLASSRFQRPTYAVNAKVLVMVWFGFMSGSPVLRPSERLSYHCVMLQVISGRTELETYAFTASTPWSGSFELFGALRVGCTMDMQDLCQT